MTGSMMLIYHVQTMNSVVEPGVDEQKSHSWIWNPGILASLFFPTLSYFGFTGILLRFFFFYIFFSPLWPVKLNNLNPLLKLSNTNCLPLKTAKATSTLLCLSLSSPAPLSSFVNLDNFWLSKWVIFNDPLVILSTYTRLPPHIHTYTTVCS